MSSIQSASVCVIGGAGFLGSHLVQYLIEQRDCRAVVIDNLITGRKEHLHEKAIFEYADITESEYYLHKLFKYHNVEYVFNYAAEPYIPKSFKRPLHVFNINAMGALKVINAAQEAGVKGILQVSSAEIYGEGAGHPIGTDASLLRIKETSPVVPHSTYGAAKAAIDNLIQVRWKESGTPCIALRQFNCIGERETHPYVVPEIIGQLSKQFQKMEFVECTTCAAKPGMPILCDDCLKRRSECGKTSATPGIVSLGNNSFRDFQYAGDAVRNAVLLLESERYGEVFNMGSEQGIKIYALAKLIGKLMGFETVEVAVDNARIRPWEIWHLQSDNTKLWQTISQQPVTSLEESLKKTINSYYVAGKWGWE